MRNESLFGGPTPTPRRRLCGRHRDDEIERARTRGMAPLPAYDFVESSADCEACACERKAMEVAMTGYKPVICDACDHVAPEHEFDVPPSPNYDGGRQCPNCGAPEGFIRIVSCVSTSSLVGASS